MSSTKKTKGSKEYGRGGVYQKKDGRWVVKFKGLVLYFPKNQKSEAVSKLDELRFADARGQVRPSELLVSEYFSKWIADLSETKWSPVTADNYKGLFKNHIEVPLGGLRMCDVKTEDIQKLLNSKSKDYMRGTIRDLYVLLKGLFRYACADRGLTWNPVDGVLLPPASKCKKRETPRAKSLSKDECKRLEAVALTEKKGGGLVYSYGPLVVLMLHTGLRSGEARGLLWRNVDLKKCTLTVEQGLVYATDRASGEASKRVLQRKDPKTENGKRTMDLTPMAVAVLEMMRKQAVSKNLPCGADDYIAHTSTGKPVDSATLRKALARMAKAAGIEQEVFPHLCRHTFATRSINELGINEGVVSEVLGHKHVSTTIDYYVHSTSELKQKAKEAWTKY